VNYMHPEVREQIITRGFGEIDVQGPPFHELDPSCFPYPVIVNRPCLYTEIVKGTSAVVLCWRNRKKEQEEFPLTIVSKKLLWRLRPYRLFLTPIVLFIGQYSDVPRQYLTESLCQENLPRPPGIVLVVNNMGSRFLIGIDLATPPGKTPAYPQTFEF